MSRNKDVEIAAYSKTDCGFHLVIVILLTCFGTIYTDSI